MLSLFLNLWISLYLLRHEAGAPMQNERRHDSQLHIYKILTYPPPHLELIYIHFHDTHVSKGKRLEKVYELMSVVALFGFQGIPNIKITYSQYNDSRFKVIYLLAENM